MSRVREAAERLENDLIQLNRGSMSSLFAGMAVDIITLIQFVYRHKRKRRKK